MNMRQAVYIFILFAMDRDALPQEGLSAPLLPPQHHHSCISKALYNQTAMQEARCMTRKKSIHFSHAFLRWGVHELQNQCNIQLFNFY
ncbi:hypothetical protein F4782DRAFT_479037 [Xylaria castorea]|nr:hypothetical protein F4782DRAFT_479037 [Xylaria castorea]